VGDGKLIIISMTVSGINDRIRFYIYNIRDLALYRLQLDKATPPPTHS